MSGGIPVPIFRDRNGSMTGSSDVLNCPIGFPSPGKNVRL